LSVKIVSSVKSAVINRFTVKKRYGCDLTGDRDIEWSWVASQMPKGPGEALDFGPGGSSLGLIAAEAGYNVTAIDLQPITWPYHHPNLRFVQGDVLKLQLQKNHFDLIINCSVIEHVGLAGLTE